MSLFRLKGHERKAQIIEVAADLFASQGFSGTTTRKIAEAAGVSEATLFKHFSTKEDLYTAIIDAKTRPERIIEAARDAAARGDDRAVFTTVARNIIEGHRDNPALMRLLLHSALDGHDLSTLFFASRVGPFHRFLSDYIARRAAEGAFRDLHPLVAARAFIAMAVHYVLLYQLFGVEQPEGQTEEGAVETFVELFLEGVTKK